uniref:granzyme E-like n=1 Tax=Monopterus albus TaxID=43700 RepID=UPI0009B317ED|nr:granzyme E-like [Monopterus albus]XP_020467958.1 granzyme E-like [Monopterus albus]
MTQSHILKTTQTLPSSFNTRKHLKTDIFSEVCLCSSVAQLDCDLTMFINCKLVILILVISLDGQAHTAKIIGGHEAVPHSRTYMALLECHTSNGEKKYCGGFLLNEDFVITAAHCQAKSYVLLGLHNFHNKAEVQGKYVERSFPHKDFNGTCKNDIMLLKLSSKAHFNKNVRPIALGDHSGLPKACTVSGWGRDNTSDLNSVVLMEVNVKLIDHKRCDEDNLYCSEGETGPAEGDSGGPLVCEDGKAYGVFAGFFKTKSDLKTYVYTKIPDIKEWIESTMKIV